MVRQDKDTEDPPVLIRRDKEKPPIHESTELGGLLVIASLAISLISLPLATLIGVIGVILVALPLLLFVGGVALYVAVVMSEHGGVIDGW